MDEALFLCFLWLALGVCVNWPGKGGDLRERIGVWYPKRGGEYNVVRSKRLWGLISRLAETAGYVRNVHKKSQKSTKEIVRRDVQQMTEDLD